MLDQHKMAKMALNRPEAFLRQYGAERVKVLRVYPAALMAIWRADNCPKKLKLDIEDMLETAGFQILT